MKTTLSLPSAWLEHDKNVKPYLWSHRVLSMGRTFLTLGLLVWFVVSLRAFQLEDYLEKNLQYTFLVWLAYFGIISAVLEMATFLFSISHHWIERSYELSKQSYAGWFWDKVKGWILGAVLGTVFLGILYLCVAHLEGNWWIVTAILFVAVSIVLAQLAPVILIPILF